MDEFERVDDFVIDNERSSIHCSEGRQSTTFDFKNMSFYTGRRISQPKPIRYDSEREEILYWVTGKWNTFNKGYNIVVLRLFNNYHERTLLGLNSEEHYGK